MDYRSLEEIILKVPKVFCCSFLQPFEVAPGEFSPIYINMKYTLQDDKIRKLISDQLAKLIGDDYDYICGIESGANYYVSAVSDILKTPLSFFRHKRKGYGEKKFISGAYPQKGNRIAIVDDVFATGITSEKAVKYFRSLGFSSSVFAIFSYGYEREIGKKLGVHVSALTNFDSVAKDALKLKIINLGELKKLKEHISTYKNYIKG